MRRLATTLLLLGAVLGLTSPGRASAADTRPHVDVVEISGLIDPVQADFIHRTLADAQHGGAAAVVMRINSGGAGGSPAGGGAPAAGVSPSLGAGGGGGGARGGRAGGGGDTPGPAPGAAR